MADQSFHDRLNRINANLGSADGIGQTITRAPVEPAYVAAAPKSYNQMFWHKIATNIFLGLLWMLPTALAIRYFPELSLWFENEPGTAGNARDFQIGLGIAIVVSLGLFGFFARDAVLTLGRTDGTPVSLIIGGALGFVAGLGPLLVIELIKLAATA